MTYFECLCRSRNTLGCFLEKVINLHSLLRIFGKPLEVGLMVLPLKVGLLTTTVSLLYLSNLLVYITSHMLTTSVSLVNLLCFSVIGHVIVWIISCVFEILIRNIRPKWAFSEKRQDLSSLVKSVYPHCNCDQCQKSGDIHVPECPLWTGRSEDNKPVSSSLKQIVQHNDFVSPSVLQVGFVSSLHKGSGESIQRLDKIQLANSNSSNVCTNLLNSIVDPIRGKPYLEQLIGEIADWENLLSWLGAKHPFDILADSSLGERDGVFPYTSEKELSDWPDLSTDERNMGNDVLLLKHLNQNKDGAFSKLCEEIEEFDEMLSGHEVKISPLFPMSQIDREIENVSEGNKETEDTLNATVITGAKSGVSEDLSVLKTITDLHNPEPLHSIMSDIRKVDRLLEQGKASLSSIYPGKDTSRLESGTKGYDVTHECDENTVKTRRSSSTYNGKVKDNKVKRKTPQNLCASTSKHSISRYLLTPDYQNFQDFSSLEDFERAFLSEVDIIQKPTKENNLESNGLIKKNSKATDDEIKPQGVGYKKRYRKQSESQEAEGSEPDKNDLKVLEKPADESVEPDASAGSLIGVTSVSRYRARLNNILGGKTGSSRQCRVPTDCFDKIESNDDTNDLKASEDFLIDGAIELNASTSNFSMSEYLLAPDYHNFQDFSSVESGEDLEMTVLSKTDARQQPTKERIVPSKGYKGQSRKADENERKTQVVGLGRKYKKQGKIQNNKESEPDRNCRSITDDIRMDESSDNDVNADSLLEGTTAASKYRTRFLKILGEENTNGKDMEFLDGQKRYISQGSTKNDSLSRKKAKKKKKQKGKYVSSKSQKRRITPGSTGAKDYHSYAEDTKTGGQYEDETLRQVGHDDSSEVVLAGLGRPRKTEKSKNKVRNKERIRGKGQMKSELSNNGLDKTIDYQPSKASNDQWKDDIHGISQRKSDKDYSLELDDTCGEVEESLKQTLPEDNVGKGRESEQKKDTAGGSRSGINDDTHSSDFGCKKKNKRDKRVVENLSDVLGKKQHKTSLQTTWEMKEPHSIKEAQNKATGRNTMDLSEPVKHDRSFTRQCLLSDDFLGEGPSHQAWESNGDLRNNEDEFSITDSAQRRKRQNKAGGLNSDIYSENSLQFGRRSVGRLMERERNSDRERSPSSHEEDQHSLDYCEEVGSSDIYDEYPVVSRRSNTRYYLYEDCTKYDESIHDEFEATCKQEASKALKQFGAKKVPKRTARNENEKIPKTVNCRRKPGKQNTFSETYPPEEANIIGSNTNDEYDETQCNSEEKERRSRETRRSEILQNVYKTVKRRSMYLIVDNYTDSEELSFDDFDDTYEREMRDSNVCEETSVHSLSDAFSEEISTQKPKGRVRPLRNTGERKSTYMLVPENDSGKKRRDRKNKKSTNGTAKSKKVNKKSKKHLKATCRDSIRENEKFATLLKEISVVDDPSSRLTKLSQEITESDNTLHLAGAQSSLAVRRLISSTSDMQSKGPGLNDERSQNEAISPTYKDTTTEKSETSPFSDLTRCSDVDVLMSIVKSQNDGETMRVILHDIHEFDTALKLAGAENSPIIKDLMSGGYWSIPPLPYVSDPLSPVKERCKVDQQDVEAHRSSDAGSKTKPTHQKSKKSGRLSPNAGEGLTVNKTAFKPPGKQKVLDLMNLIVEGNKNPDLLRNILRDIQSLDDLLSKSGVTKSPVLQTLMKDSALYDGKDITEDNDSATYLRSAESSRLAKSSKSSELTSPSPENELAGVESRKDNLIRDILGPNATNESLEGILKDIQDFDTILNKRGFGRISQKQGKYHEVKGDQIDKLNRVAEPENNTQSAELYTFQGPSVATEEVSLLNKGNAKALEDNGHAVRMLKSIITDRRKGPFQEILQDMMDFDSAISNSEVGSNPRIRKVLDIDRIAVWGQGTDKDDYDLVPRYSSQEWNGTTPKPYRERKETKETKKRKSPTPIKCSTTSTFSKAGKGKKQKILKNVAKDNTDNHQNTVSNLLSEISTRSNEVQPAGTEDFAGSESFYFESYDVTDKRDFLMKKILRTLHGFHILVSSLNDVDYNQLDMLIDFLRRGENKVSTELSTEIIEMLDRTQGHSGNRRSVLKTFHQVAMEPSTAELSSGGLSKSTSSVDTMDKSCEAVSSRDYLSDDSQQTKPKPTRQRSAQKPTGAKSRYVKSPQRKGRVKSVQSDGNDVSDESAGNESVHDRTDLSLAGNTENMANLGVNDMHTEQENLELTGQESTETLKPAMNSSSEDQRQLTRVGSQVHLSVASLGPQVEENAVGSASTHKPQVCFCVIEVLAKVLVENSISIATQDLSHEFDSVISVFHRYLVIGSTMSLLKKWRIPAHTDLLNEVLQEVFWHLESQGFGRMSHPDLYLSKALLLQRMSQKSKHRYTLTLFLDTQAHRNSTLKLEDIIHFEHELARALRKKAKECVKAELKVCLKDINSHVVYSESFGNPNPYLSSVFLFYIDSLTDKTTSFPMEVFSDLVKNFEPRKKLLSQNLVDPRDRLVSTRYGTHLR